MGSGARGVPERETPTVRVRGLSARYAGVDVIHDVDLDLSGATVTGLLGPNGAGKSTLIKALLGQVPSRGRVERNDGRPLDLRRVAYVPQRSGIDFTFPITAVDVVVQGTFAAMPWWRRPGRVERHWALECLNVVGLADHAERRLGDLSGGQAARVFIARALAQRPEVFLLDEPFAAIDVASEERILDVMFTVARAGSAVLVVHHNLDQAAEYFDEVIVLNRTVLAAGPPSRALTADVLTEAFPGDLMLARLTGPRER